jgi:hypothetical protein
MSTTKHGATIAHEAAKAAIDRLVTAWEMESAAGAPLERLLDDLAAAAAVITGYRDELVAASTGSIAPRPVLQAGPDAVHYRLGGAEVWIEAGDVLVHIRRRPGQVSAVLFPSRDAEGAGFVGALGEQDAAAANAAADRRHQAQLLANKVFAATTVPDRGSVALATPASASQYAVVDRLSRAVLAKGLSLSEAIEFAARKDDWGAEYERDAQANLGLRCSGGPVGDGWRPTGDEPALFGAVSGEVDERAARAQVAALILARVDEWGGNMAPVLVMDERSLVRDCLERATRKTSHCAEGLGRWGSGTVTVDGVDCETLCLAYTPGIPQTDFKPYDTMPYWRWFDGGGAELMVHAGLDVAGVVHEPGRFHVVVALAKA